MILVSFKGGPQDGKVGLVQAREVPLMLASKPRDRMLFDTPQMRAIWNEASEWYEGDAAPEPQAVA